MAKSIKHDKKAVKATEKYLNALRDGYEIIDSYDIFPLLDIFDLVAIHENEIVFIQVRRFDGVFPHEVPIKKLGQKRRGRMETALYRWLGWNDEYLDMPIRFDVIDIFIPDVQDRAVVRHHINAGSDN